MLSILRHPARCTTSVAGLFILTLAVWQAMPAWVSPAVVTGNTVISALSSAEDRLSERDEALYRASFAAQARGEFTSADASMAEITNTRLFGSLLAERYRYARYRATNTELSDWLATYATHPKAASIAAMARARGMDGRVIKADAPLKGEGYTDHLGRTTMPDGWYRGLALWKEGDFTKARAVFEMVAGEESLSDWQRAAGHFWAARAAHKLGDQRAKRSHLADAAAYPTTFYGLLANAQRGDVNLKAQAPDVPSRVRRHPQVIEAKLLIQLERTEEAEATLRHLYSQLLAKDRTSLVTLAAEFGLPNLQVRLARIPGLSEAEARFAQFPMPEALANAQTVVDPALILAIARNESGFRTQAASGAGALGMMQILPSTAQAIERRVGHEALEMASISADAGVVAARLNDPKTSAKYAAHYVQMLTKEPALGANLIKILAGYNAGPGSVTMWQSAAKKVEDPLLYVESIPYPETRNYVMQVLAQYWVYQSLRGESTTTLDAMAKGQWPQLAGR